MSFFSTLFTGSGGGILSGLFNLGGTLISNNAQKKENAKQRRFEAEQAQLNRDFEAEQAQMNRDFQSKEAEEAYARQVEFYEQNQSIGAQVNQYKEAGLNPALLAGGVSAASSAPSSSAPSGSMALGSMPHGSAASLSPINIDFLTQALNLEDLKANIELKKAEARNAAATALSTEIDNLTRGEMNEMTLRKGYSAIAHSDADTASKIEQTKLFIAETIKSEASTKQILENTRLTTEQILTERVDRNLKNEQIRELGARIADLQVSKELKVVSILNVLADTDMKKQQASYFLSAAGVNDANVGKIWEETAKLRQQYKHDEIMNVFSEIEARASSNLAEFFDVNHPDANAAERMFMGLYHLVEGLVDFSAGAGVTIKK